MRPFISLGTKTSLVRQAIYHTPRPGHTTTRRFHLTALKMAAQQPQQQQAEEATPHQIKISPSNTGLWGSPRSSLHPSTYSGPIIPEQSPSASSLLSSLLQTDMLHHHVFFNTDGFHNHIPHHLLALYGTSSPAEALQKAYDVNASYQRPVLPEHPPIISDLIQNWSSDAKKYLGKEEHYPDFLAFFKREMDSREGKYEEVVNEFLFSGTKEADNMLVRLYSGFLHPLIQLMYGLEWRQPAIVAEGLAQAAVHGDDIGVYLLGAEETAKENKEEEIGTVLELLEKGVRGNEKLRTAARMGDGNKIRDGVLKRAKEEAIKLAGRVKVRKEELEKRTAEMYDAAVFMASAAALVKRESKLPRFDFFLMHHITSAPFFTTVNAQDWISLDTKVRLLEWKIRMDLVQYAARGAPELSLDAITSYQPKQKTNSETPEEIISNLHFFEDDGHSIKLARAARVCQLYYQTRDDDYWNKIYHLIVDSVLAPGPNWVRSCGFDEAWEEVPNVE